eukprot:5806176-Lingulodinium_polyedra.AAC.1
MRATVQWGVLGLPRRWQGLLISIGLIHVGMEDSAVDASAASMLAIAGQDGDKPEGQKTPVKHKRGQEEQAKTEPTDPEQATTPDSVASG